MSSCGSCRPSSHSDVARVARGLAPNSGGCRGSPRRLGLPWVPIRSRSPRGWPALGGQLVPGHVRLLTYEHLLERVWGEKSSGDVRPMRTIVSKLRRKLGDDADNPTYIFTEPRVGYRMPKGKGLGQED